jgi:hypothetical protein
MLRRLLPWPGLCSGVRACVAGVMSLKAAPHQKTRQARPGNRNRGAESKKNIQQKRKKERKKETCSLPRFVHNNGGAKTHCFHVSTFWGLHHKVFGALGV